jgi:hypothetical protein
MYIWWLFLDSARVLGIIVCSYTFVNSFKNESNLFHLILCWFVGNLSPSPRCCWSVFPWFLPLWGTCVFFAMKTRIRVNKTFQQSQLLPQNGPVTTKLSTFLVISISCSGLIVSPLILRHKVSLTPKIPSVLLTNFYSFWPSWRNPFLYQKRYEDLRK